MGHEATLTAIARFGEEVIRPMTSSLNAERVMVAAMYTGSLQLLAREVIEHRLEQMATFKVPRYVRFVTEWSMSGTKIQKARLRQRIADELTAASVTEAPRLTRPEAPA